MKHQKKTFRRYSESVTDIDMTVHIDWTYMFGCATVYYHYCSGVLNLSQEYFLTPTFQQRSRMSLMSLSCNSQGSEKLTSIDIRN